MKINLKKEKETYCVLLIKIPLIAEELPKLKGLWLLAECERESLAQKQSLPVHATALPCQSYAEGMG